MDREAWQAAVHRVTKSQTRLSNYFFKAYAFDGSWPLAVSPVLCGEGAEFFHCGMRGVLTGQLPCARCQEGLQAVGASLHHQNASCLVSSPCK